MTGREGQGERREKSRVGRVRTPAVSTQAPRHQGGREGKTRTICKNSFPTQSCPVPPSSTSPNASSSRSANSSEKTASSETLLKMILVSSRVIGGPPTERYDAAEESDAVESVREDDADDPGGVAGVAANGAGWPGPSTITLCEWEEHCGSNGGEGRIESVNGRSLGTGLTLFDVPRARGIWMSRMSARSDAYARSDVSSSMRAWLRLLMGGEAEEREEAETEGRRVSSSSSSGSRDKGMEPEGCGVRGNGLSGVVGRCEELAEGIWSKRPESEPKLRECSSGMSSASVLALGASGGYALGGGPRAVLPLGRRGDRGGIGGDVVGGEEGAN